MARTSARAAAYLFPFPRKLVVAAILVENQLDTSAAVAWSVAARAAWRAYRTERTLTSAESTLTNTAVTDVIVLSPPARDPYTQVH